MLILRQVRLTVRTEFVDSDMIDMIDTMLLLCANNLPQLIPRSQLPRSWHSQNSSAHHRSDAISLCLLTDDARQPLFSVILLRYINLSI